MAYLASGVAFRSELMDAGVEFVAVDNPHANRLNEKRTRNGVRSSNEWGVGARSSRTGSEKGSRLFDWSRIFDWLSFGSSKPATRSAVATGNAKRVGASGPVMNSMRKGAVANILAFD